MENRTPLVSICIPVHNGGVNLEKTVESVLFQSFQDWELIVSDDHSSDGHFESLRERFSGDKRFLFLNNPGRSGAANNWNYCSNFAKGKYLKILCQDDILLANSLDLCVAEMEKNSRIALVTGRRGIIDQHGKVLIRSRGNQGIKGLVTGKHAISTLVKKGTNIICEPSIVLYRAEIFRSTVGFDSNWNYLIDIASYVEVLRHGDLYCIDCNLGYFRISPTSWSSQLQSTQAKEFRQFVNHLAADSYWGIGRIQLLRSKITINISALVRRLIFRFIRD